MTEPLQKIDSAVQGLDTTQEDKLSAATAAAKRRASSHAAPGVWDIKVLATDETERLVIDPAIFRTRWQINVKPTKESGDGAVADPDILTRHLTKPPVKKIDLEFSNYMAGNKYWEGNGKKTHTKANRTGVTIKDALTAIYDKSSKKDADDEIHFVGLRYQKDKDALRLLVCCAPNAGEASSLSKMLVDEEVNAGNTTVEEGPGGSGGGDGKKKKGKKGKKDEEE